MVVLVQSAERSRDKVRLDVQVAQTLVVDLITHLNIAAVSIKVLVYLPTECLRHALAHYLNGKLLKNTRSRLYQKSSASVYLEIELRVPYVKVMQLKF